MRLKLTAPLRSRDGTLAKSAGMKNALAELHGDKVKLVKRPGLAILLSGSAMTGQGCIEFGGFLFNVSDDVLRKIIVSPPSASTTWTL